VTSVVVWILVEFNRKIIYFTSLVAVHFSFDFHWIWTFCFPRVEQGHVRSQLVLGLSLFLRWPF
jgi:hypothetical protein